MRREDESTRVTVLYKDILNWMEERDGIPCRLKDGSEAKHLGIGFPDDFDEEKLEKISWDEFFDTIRRDRLAFVYEEEKEGEAQKTFYKFVDRDSVDIE